MPVLKGKNPATAKTTTAWAAVVRRVVMGRVALAPVVPVPADQVADPVVVAVDVPTPAARAVAARAAVNARIFADAPMIVARAPRPWRCRNSMSPSSPMIKASNSSPARFA